MVQNKCIAEGLTILLYRQNVAKKYINHSFCRVWVETKFGIPDIFNQIYYTDIFMLYIYIHLHRFWIHN